MIIKVDQEKATEVAKSKVRAWRDSELKKNDVILQNALADGDEELRQQAVLRRDYLRDLPTECDGKTIEELKELLETFTEEK